MLTAHIPLPDPARGEVSIWDRGDDSWNLVQTAFSNYVLVAEVRGERRAIRTAAELNTRMAVAKKFGA